MTLEHKKRTLAQLDLEIEEEILKKEKGIPANLAEKVALRNQVESEIDKAHEEIIHRLEGILPHN